MRAFLCVVELPLDKQEGRDMRVITSIGEQGLTHPDGRQVVLRPSLYAMTQLGSPREIVELFAELHEPPRLIQSMSWDHHSVVACAERCNKTIMRRHWLNMLFLSWQVMTACCDGDLTPFIGEPGTRYGSYRLGPVPPEAMLVMARSLLRYGLIGPIEEKTPEQLEAEADQPRDRSKFTKEFDALGFVSRAVTHLGMSEAEAWNMTVTSFSAHWQAKYGEQKEKRHSEEHDSTMKWLAEVNKLRDASK